MGVTVGRRRGLARAVAVGAACLYVVACGLPVALKDNLASGNPSGFYSGYEVLLLGWITVLGQPLLFVAWLSNFPWLAGLVGCLARGPVRWVRRCAIVGLVCAVPAVLPVWPDRVFGDLPGRYWWFASYVLLAVACWAWPQEAESSVPDSLAAELGTASDRGGR